MKLFILAAATLFTSLAAAGVVITPIRPEQVIPKASDDCYFGVTTPQGCGYVSSLPLSAGTFMLTDGCRPARSA